MIKPVCCEMITVTSQRGTNGFTVIQCGGHLNVRVYWLQVSDEMVLRQPFVEAKNKGFGIFKLKGTLYDHLALTSIFDMQVN